MLTDQERLQLELAGVHRLAQQADARHRIEIRADVVTRWPKTSAFIDQLFEQRMATV